MAGAAILSAFMHVLFERLSTIALHEFRSVRGINNELENLFTLSTIQRLLEDAEKKQLKDKYVRDWLAKLKDVVYDLDDLLDGRAAEALRSKLEDNQSNGRWKRQLQGHLCIACLENVASRGEANEAKLHIKEYLSLLEFVWGNNRDISLHQECLNEVVIEGLRPHHELKRDENHRVCRCQFSKLASKSTLQPADHSSIQLYKMHTPPTSWTAADHVEPDYEQYHMQLYCHNIIELIA